MAPYLPIPVPTWTTTDTPSRVVARQAVTTVTVVATNDDCVNCTQLSGGAIAGIVIGSIFGFLLLLWIIRSCFNLGAPPKDREKAGMRSRDTNTTIIATTIAPAQTGAGAAEATAHLLPTQSRRL
ncbi:unnamed protein product [Clonostachys solani]|uniref:Transmembrane protein n=1 Tax=Clonostachys solani TaxID=160281 RepID=A0A9N9Z6N9_9HYPO|nr:unnamed protein product [Clonostachys solani]